MKNYKTISQKYCHVAKQNVAVEEYRNEEGNMTTQCLNRFTCHENGICKNPKIENGFKQML